MRKSIIFTFFLIFLVGFMIREASAISAWGRRTGMDCSVCHYRINRLNQTGLDYYRHGFRVGDKEATKNLGDYFSIQGNITARGTKEEKTLNVRSLNVTVYGGGSFDSHFSFLAETTVNPPDAQEVADLFIQYVTTHKNFGSVRFGQFLPLLTVDNPFEVAADRSEDFGRPFLRERRFGGEVAFNNEDKFWGSVGFMQSADPLGIENKDLYDAVLSGQYIVNDKGTSIGGFAWLGHYHGNPADVNETTPFRRYSVVGNYNTDKLLLSGGAGWGTGNSAEGGTADVRGFYGNIEYVVTDKIVPQFNWTWADPDTDLSDNEANIFTINLFWWVTPYLSLRPGFVYVSPTSGESDYNYRIEARFMF